MENLHEYKLHRKQVGLLPEGDHQGRPACAYDEAGYPRAFHDASTQEV